MSDTTAISSSLEPISFESRIIETAAGSCRLYMLPVAVNNVVSWRGAFMSNPAFENGDDLRQGLVVSLLDKGSKHRDRFELAEVLENRGAQVNYYNGGIGVGFSGKCLKRDTHEVWGVMAEQLKEPAMQEEEFQKAQMQVAASIQRSLERTGTQAYIGLCREIYDRSHPNYSLTPADELQLLSEITLDSLQEYHRNHFGSNDLMMVVVGDIDPDHISRSVQEHFGSWMSHTASPTHAISGRLNTPERIRLPMEDKSSIDVRIGHAVEIRRNDHEYVPLYLGNFILGGNFSSRLMNVIRDDMGLTYGIRSGLAGISRYYEGHWQVSVTLSEDNLLKGLDAIRSLLENYVQEGVTQEELEEKKTTVVGTFNVELATTGGMASNILRGIQNGFGVAYIDDFPRKVNAATLEEVNSAIQKHIRPDMAHLVLAGTLPGESA